MKKRNLILTFIIVCSLSLYGCSSEFNIDNEITVISREAGSGTRDAFTDLFNIQQTDQNGVKRDLTIPTADINNSTGIMMINTSSNKHAIGYISFGSINQSIKVLNINGVEATGENVRNGSYQMARPFNIATKTELSEETIDFIDFILSMEGQKIVENNGYIPLDETEPYLNKRMTGRIVIVGSSSVTPLMEKLREAYIELNPQVTIEIQQSDSSSGMKAIAENICDIGMASRELKTSELEQGIHSTVIALDGIAIVVNNENPIDNLTTEQVKDIYTGKITRWNQIPTNQAD
jgi:ABC-type phosphate transport system, periplasmic component